jgi:DNA-binding IclR family transcriptional regulator
MGLIDLKNYLRQQRQASLTELARHFRLEPDTVRAMLGHWQRKGKVVEVPSGACGKACLGCHSAPGVEIYRWRDEAADGISIPLKSCG